MKSPKKSLLFKDLTDRINKDKGTSGYENIVKPFNSTSVPVLDDEELQLGMGQDNIPAAYLDHMNLSAGERRSQDVRQIEFDKNLAQERKNLLKVDEKTMSDLNTKEKSLKKVVETVDSKAEVEQIKVEKLAIAKKAEQSGSLEDIQKEINTIVQPYLAKGADKNTDFLDSPILWTSEASQNLIAKATNQMFSEPEKQMKPEEKAKYQNLIKQRDIFYKPIAEQRKQDLAVQLEAVKMETFSRDSKASIGDKIELFFLQKRLEDKMTNLDDYVSGATGAENIYKELSNQALFIPVAHALTDFFIRDDIEKKVGGAIGIDKNGKNMYDPKGGYANLTKKEKLRLDAYSFVDETDAFLSDKQKWSYGMTEGIAHSLGFVRDMFIGSTAVKGIGKALGARTAVSIGTKVAQKTGSALLGKAAAIGAKAGNLSASYALQSQLNKSMTNEELMKGSHIERDDKGNIKNIYVKDQLHDYMSESYKNLAIVYSKEQKTLEAKENLNLEETERLQYLKVKLGLESDLNEHSLAEELETYKPSSLLKAEALGFAKTATENLAELYTGKMLGVIGRGINKIPGVGKFTTKVGNRVEDLNTSYNRSKVGKLHKLFTAPLRSINIDGNRLIGSMPEEIVEEYVTSGMNSIIDRDPKEFIDMFDVQGNIDIAVQTLVMSGMFGLPGNVQTATKVRYNKLIEKRLAELQPGATAAQMRLAEINNLLTPPSTPPSNNTSPSTPPDIEKLTEEKAKHEATIAKFKLFKDNPSYTGLNIMSAVAGKGNTFSATAQYVKSRKEINNTINELRAVSTDARVNEILNLGSLSGFGIAEQRLKIEALRAEDKNSEANLVEKTMFQNLILQSFRADVHKEFEQTLGQLARNKNISPETKLQVSKAQEQVKTLSKIYEQNKGKANLSNIITLAVEKLSAKEGLNEIEQDKLALAQQTREEIDAFRLAKGHTIDYDLDSLFTREFTNLAEQDAYDKFLTDLSNYTNTTIDNYIGLNNSKDKLTDHIGKTTLALSEAMYPSLESVNNTRTMEFLQQELNSVESGISGYDKAQFTLQNKLIVTEELINEIFEKNKANLVGKFTEGKVSETDYNKLKNNTLQTIKSRNLQSQLASIAQLQAATTQANTIVEQDNTTFEDETEAVEVIDEVAEEEFATFASNVEDDSNIFFGEDIPDFSNIIISEDDLDNMLGNESYTPEQLAFVKKAMYDITLRIQEITGQQEVSFKEAMSQYFKYFKDKNNLRSNFRHFVRGWKENGYTVSNGQALETFDSLFNVETDVMKVEEGILNLFNASVVPAPLSPVTVLEEQAVAAQAVIIDNSPVVIGYDEENLPISRTSIEAIDSQRSLNILPKASYNAIAFEEVIEDGVMVRKSVSSVLNLKDGDYIDFRDLIHPDKYATGSKLFIEVSDESLWKDISVTNGRNSAGKQLVIPFAEWVATRERANPNFRQTENFKNKVPVFYTNEQGKRLAYVTDVDWYNPYNVENPFGKSNNPNIPTPEWAAHINQGKENTRALREAISNGLKSVTVNRLNQEGVFHKLFDEEPLISISESNPQAIMRVQNGDTIGNLPKEFQDGTSVLLNDPKDFDIVKRNGHTWAIYRIGTSMNDKKEPVKTYRAFPINSAIGLSEIEQMRWALAAHQAYSGKSLPGKYRMSKEQALELFIKPIAKHTGLNISDTKEIINYVKSFGQLKMAVVYTLRRPTDTKAYTADHIIPYLRLLLEDNNNLNNDSIAENFIQHTNAKRLTSNSNTVTLSNAGAVPTLRNGKPVSYEEYIKDTLLINIKAFNVGTESNPMYATSIQPIINVEYTSTAVATVQQTPQQVAQQAVAAVIAEDLETTEEKIVPLSSHLDLLKSLKIDLELFENDDMIGDISKLDNLFSVIGNLTIPQEKTIRQFVTNKLGAKIGFEYKTKIKREKLSNEIKYEIDLKLKPIKAAVEKFLSEANKNQLEQSEALITTYNSILLSIDSIQNNFSEFFDKSFEDIKKQTQLTEIESELEVENVNENELSEKNYNKDSIEESGKSKASYRLRRFFSEIPKYDSKGVAEVGFLSFDEFMTFNEVYNQLTQVLALGSEIVSDYDLIINKLKQSKSPFVKNVLTKLENADEQIKNEFVSNFVRHTLSSKFVMFDSIKGTSLKVFDTNSNEIGRIIQNKWVNETKASDLYRSNGTFNVDYAQQLLAEARNWDKDSTKTNKKELKLWLEKIGMYMNENTWKEITEKGIFNKNKVYDFKALYSVKAGGLFPQIISFLEEGVLKPDNYDFSKDTHVFSNLVGVVNAISNIEAQYNPQLVALSYRDSGKNIYGQVPTKYFTDLVNQLKRSANGENSLIDDLQSLSLSKSSLMLKLLKEDASFKTLFEASHLGLTAIKEKGTKPKKAGVSDLGEADYDMLTLGLFQDRKGKQMDTTTIDGISVRIAKMLSPTMSDKTTALPITTVVFDLMKDSDLLFGLVGTKTKMESTLKEMLYKQLVQPELERIINFHLKIKNTNIANYDKAAGLFHFLPVMNTIKSSNGISLIKRLAETEDYTLEQIEEEYSEQFMEAIERVVEQEVEHKKELWRVATTNENKFSGNPMFDTNYFKEVNKAPSENFEIAVYDFVINSMIFNSEIFKVFAGDIANYSQDKVFKGMENIYSAKEDAKYVSINKQIGVNLGKRLALLIAPGNKLANSYNEKYNQIMLQDSVDITENADYLIGLYYGPKERKTANLLLDKYTKIAQTVNLYEQGNTNISPENLEKLMSQLGNLRKELATKYPKLDAYFDIESTDAQEYSTVSEHVELIYRLGRLSTRDYQTILTKIASTGKASNLSKRELKIVLQPIKPVHTGTYVNKDFDVNRVVYVKSSSFPLLPQFTEGTKLDALRVKMEELESTTGRFTRASFGTANKVGATKNTVNPFDVNSLEKIKAYSETDLDSTVLVLNRNNFRIQQDVPFKSDKKKYDTIAMGSQFFKLLFGDGVIDETGFKIGDKEYTGKELYTHYAKAFETIVSTQMQELFMDLGLNSEGQITNQAVFVNKLQELLVSEATSRGYSIKSLRGLSIEKIAVKAGVTAYEFKTPLWLSSDSNRYESLLNSIITNKLMKHKFPGNGFVAGSEAGIKFKEGLEGIKMSEVIFLDSFNGKGLQGVKDDNGIFSKAQVLMPSKFKNSNKELVDLFEGYDEQNQEGKYIKRDAETKKLMLKTDMIDPELLNNFSFRTPTSSHVSGSSIEVVGFLPAEMGDLIIVPKNFTKQKGLDYDVDKEGVYQLNHTVDETGRISVLNQEYVDSKKANIQSLLDKIEKDNAFLDIFNIRNEIVNLTTGTGSFFDEGEISLLELLKPEEFSSDTKEKPLKEILAKLSFELDRKLAENEYIRVHLAVYNNPKIQGRINQILSMEFAKGQATKFESLNEEGVKNSKVQEYLSANSELSLEKAEERYDKEALNFSMLHYSYQRNKMSLGAIGKTAIGVYANFTTFNGLLQQSSAEIYIADSAQDPKTLTIGNSSSSGILGRTSTIDGQRTIAEVFAEKENTATDNEKEQVLGRVGVNEFTINVDAYMTLRGFDKDENGNSISYLLLSQPAVREFNNQKKKNKSILGRAQKEVDAIAEMIEKLSNGNITYKQVPIGEEISILTFTVVGSEVPMELKGNLLTGNDMLQGIRFNGVDSDVQVQAFMNYIELEKESRAVSGVQKVVDTNTLGKSMIESQLKYDNLANLAYNPVVVNASALLGDFVAMEDNDQPKGSYAIGDFWVTPTTPQGQIVINGLHFGNLLYKDFFPYQELAFKDAISEILTAQNKEDISDTLLVENFEEIAQEFKKYIFSRKNNNIFTGQARDERFKLFKDTDVNTSLSTYLKNIIRDDSKQYGKGRKTLMNNALIKSFTYSTGKGVNELSTIEYNNAATDNLDEESLYNAIPELVKFNIPLPLRNGKEYTTRNLAEDLVSYAYLEGGIQLATQFVKFVPVEYLETVGKTQEVSVMENGEMIKKQIFIPANRKLQEFNKNSSVLSKAFGFNEDDISIFAQQYYQHKPDKAVKTTFKKVSNRNIEEETFVLNEGETEAMFLSIKNSKDSPTGEKYSLYKALGNRKYVRVQLLGQMGISEYEYLNPNAVSIKHNTLTTATATPIVPTNTITTVDLEDNTVKNLLAQISALELAPEYKHLNEAAKFLLPLVADKSVNIDNNLKTPGTSNRKLKTISINPSRTLEESNEKFAKVFMHELIHTISAEETLKYTDSTGTKLRTDIAIPAYVTNLFQIFNEFRNQFGTEITDLEKKIAAGKTNNYLGAEFTERETELIYAGTNLREFLSVSLTSPLFFEEMNKVEYKKSGKTVFEKFAEVIMDMLTKIYPGLKKDSIAKSAIANSLNFIVQENKFVNVTKTTVSSADMTSTVDTDGIEYQVPDSSQDRPPIDIDFSDNIDIPDFDFDSPGVSMGEDLMIDNSLIKKQNQKTNNNKNSLYINSILELKEGDYIQEGKSIARIEKINKTNGEFNFKLISDLDNVEINNYDYYKNLFESNEHKIKKATAYNVKIFNSLLSLLENIYSANTERLDTEKYSTRFMKNNFENYGNDSDENVVLTEYLNKNTLISPIEVLKIIEENDENFKDIAKIIKNIIIKNNFEITIATNVKKTEKDNIYVAGNYLDGHINMFLRNNDEYYSQVVLHELLHAISDDNAFQFQIDPLYKYVQKFIKDNNIDYGLKNNKEFLTEIFTNRVFQELMGKIEYVKNGKKRLSILDKFLEILSSFFKIENNSVLEQAFIILEDMNTSTNLNSKNKNNELLWSKNNLTSKQNENSFDNEDLMIGNNTDITAEDLLNLPDCN